MSNNVLGGLEWPGCGGAVEFEGDGVAAEPEEDDVLVAIGPPRFDSLGG